MIRKRLRKNATKKIAAHINNSTKITSGERIYDKEYGCYIYKAKSVITKNDAHEFVKNKSHYSELIFIEEYTLNGDIESVKIYTYGDSFNLTFKYMSDFL